MGKNRKRKRQKLTLHQSSSSAAAGLVVHPSEPMETVQVIVKDKTHGSSVSSLISDSDLEVTVRTLERIVADSCLDQKRFKALRCALHPLVLQQIQKYAGGVDYKAKTTLALQHAKWADALACLKACRDLGQYPKQGTVQRWVRDCDGAPDTCKLTLLNAILMVHPSNHASNSADPSGTTNNKHDPRIVLDTLQTQATRTSATTSFLASSDDQEEDASGDTQLQILEDWSIGRLMDPEQFEEEIPLMEALKSRILYQEAARERKPPNHYDLLLHTTTTTAPCLTWSQSPPSIIRHEVPFRHVPSHASLFLLENVLTLDECQQLRSAATTLGFRPDHPVSMDAPTGIDSCEWLVDDSILQVLNARVQSFLEQTVMEDRSFVSINPRWRFFRYGQGCVYRPHLDGSWPASRIHNGKYESYEEDSNGNRIQSYLTFLIYLNDNFHGGATRFYGTLDGRLVAQGVRPKCGSVLVFSQGHAASLIHEGSAVTQGTKYVVRTDVLYRTKSSTNKT